MLLVLDASVAVKWFVPEPLSPEARQLLPAVLDGQLQFIAPQAIFGEVGQAIRKHAREERLATEDATALVRDFLSLPVEMVRGEQLAEEAMRLCLDCAPLPLRGLSPA